MTDESKRAGRPKGARQVSQADDCEISRLLALGLRPTQVAAVIGRGRATVYNRIAALRKQPLLPLHGADQ